MEERWFRVPVYRVLEKVFPKYYDADGITGFHDAVIKDGFYHAAFQGNPDVLEELSQMYDVTEIEPFDLPETG